MRSQVLTHMIFVKSPKLLLITLITALVFPFTSVFGLTDLSITSSDISFSNTSPEPNETITITAVIRNSDSEDVYIDTTPVAAHDTKITGAGVQGVPVRGNSWYAQYFVATSSFNVGGVSIRAYSVAENPTTPLTIELRKEIGSLKPDNSTDGLLASRSTIISSTSDTWTDFIFTTNPYLVAGTTYWICAENYNVVNSTYVWYVDTGTFLVDKMVRSLDRLTWLGIVGEYDAYYKIYKCTDTIISCYAGDPDAGGSLIGTEVFATPISTDSYKTASFNWTATNGSTDIYITVDKPGLITESNKVNNTTSTTIVSIAIPPFIDGAVSPLENAVDVVPNAVVSLTFSEAMSSSTAVDSISVMAVKNASGTAIAEPITDGTINYSTTTLKLTFAVAQWQKGYTYQVTVSTEAEDLYENAISTATVWQFTVMPPPGITGPVQPLENSTTVTPSDPVSVTFWSNDMDADATKSSISVKAVTDNNGTSISESVIGTKAYSTTTYKLSFSAQWKKGYTYQVTVSTDAQDIYGNAIAAAKVWQFTTLSRPAITGQVQPEENSTSVSPSDPITVTFWSDDMDAAATELSISVKAVKDIGGSAISESVSGTVNYSTTTLQLTYSSQWKKGYTYQVTVSTDARDIYGNGIAAAKVWLFTVISRPAVTGQVLPVEDSKDAAPTDPVTITFWSDDMDAAATQLAVSVRAVLDKNGTVISEPVTGTTNFSNRTLNFAAQWSKGCTYLVTLSTGAKDIYGNSIASEISWRFTAIMDKAAENTVIDNDTKTRVTLPPGAIEADYYVLIDTQPLDSSAALGPKISRANDKRGKSSGQFTADLRASVRKISVYLSGAQYSGKFLKNASITIPYAKAANGIAVDSNGKYVKEKTLAIYYLDETKDLWVKIPNSAVDTSNGTINASVAHFSVFAILGGSDTDISNAYAYPVPWKPFDTEAANGTLADGITFTALGSEADIRIFTLSGELVRVLKYSYEGGSEQIKWDGTNSDGELCASGVYIYYIENSKEHKTGKLVIVK